MNEPLRRPFTVINPNGLHMRPLQAFVETANRFRSEVVVFRRPEERFNGKSMIQLLGLAADQGTQIWIEVRGEDAEQALDALVQTLNQMFDD